MSQKSSLIRILSILKELKEDSKINFEQLSYKHNVSERTVRRDLKIIEEVFKEINVKQKNGNVYTFKKDLLTKLLSGEELALLLNMFGMFDEFDKDIADDNLKEFKKEKSKIYSISGRPFEVLKNKELIKEIETSIKYKKKLKIVYEKRKREELIYKDFKPHKIALLNENFYIMGFDNHDEYKLIRISKIKGVEQQKETFYKQQTLINFINSVQTPWASFEEIKKIKIEVRRESKMYFEAKKFLPSQKITKENEDGSIEVEYGVTNFREIEELIIKWLPNIKIKEPIELKKYIKASLNKKLKNL